MKNVFTKGFTLIELLVVIAIIGILSSVVLASLNSARNSANQAAAKAELQAVRAEAELIYNTEGDYDTVCTAGSKAEQLWVEAADSVGLETTGDTIGDGTGCTDTANAWAAAINLDGAADNTSEDRWFCVDSTGAAREYTAQAGPPITTNACN